MNGELAQLVALVAHARVALSGDPFSLDPSNSTFKHVGSLTFEREVRRRFRTPVYESVAATPRQWYAYLAGSRARSVSIIVKRTSGTLPDHVAVAFAGGGGWASVAVYHGRQNLWRARWHPGNPNTSDGRIWSVLYRELPFAGESVQPSSIVSASRKLAQVLDEAGDFARDADLDLWREWFQSARRKLEAEQPTFEYHPDMLPSTTYSQDARRLLSACERAWVFGGMGSWNDLGFSESTLQGRYDAITPTLYDAVLDGIATAVNESLR